MDYGTFTSYIRGIAEYVVANPHDLEEILIGLSDELPADLWEKFKELVEAYL